MLYIDATEKKYPGTYGGRETNDRRKSIEDFFTKKFNHCAESNKIWLRKYKLLKYKLARATAKV